MMNRRSYYAPKMPKRERNKMPVKVLIGLGVATLILLLLICALWIFGLYLTLSWPYILLAGLALTFFLAAGAVRLFQASDDKHRLPKYGAITVLFAALMVAYVAGSLVYYTATYDYIDAYYDAPAGEYQVVVYKFTQDTPDGGTVQKYFAYRSFGKLFYQPELSDGILATDAGYRVEWTDNETCVVSTETESITVSFSLE